MANYSNRVANAQAGQTGGYKPTLYFSKVSDIETIGRPIGVPVNPGDKVSITTAHVFKAAKAAIVWDAKMHSVTHKSTNVGDDGAKEFQHTIEVKFLGDNPVTFEQIQDMLNDQMIIWVKDADCLGVDNYIQLGDDCVPVEVAPELDGKTTKDGKKEYTIVFTSKKKFFYNAALDITP